MAQGSTKRAFARSMEQELIEIIDVPSSEQQTVARARRLARMRMLWEGRRLLLKAAIYGAVLGALIAFVIPTRFASTTRLMPPDPSSGQGMAMLSMLAGRASAALGAVGTDLLGLKTSGDLFVGVLQSRSVQDELIKKFDLRTVYGESKWEDARKELGKRTDVSINRKSGIITVEIVDRDPKRAQAMAAEYISQLNSVVTQLNTSSAHRERVFLEERLEQVKNDLSAAEKEFSQFASKNSAIDIKEQGKAMVEAAAGLEGQLIAAQTELQGLRQVYADGNVRVRAAQARVSELRQQLQKLGGNPDSAGNDSLNGPEIYPSIRKLPLLGVTYADLYRRTKVQEIVFETLTQQYEMAKVQEAKEVPSIKVLDSPEVPEKKMFPPRMLITLAGAIGGLCACVFWLFLVSRWQQLEATDPGRLLANDIFQTVRPGIRPAMNFANRASQGSKAWFSRFRKNQKAEEQL